jgi:hypothetical protein
VFDVVEVTSGSVVEDFAVEVVAGIVVLVDTIGALVVAGTVSGWSASPSGDVREMYSGAGDVLTELAMAKAAPPVATSAVAARVAGRKKRRMAPGSAVGGHVRQWTLVLAPSEHVRSWSNAS